MQISSNLSHPNLVKAAYPSFFQQGEKGIDEAVVSLDSLAAGRAEERLGPTLRGLLDGRADQLPRRDVEAATRVLDEIGEQIRKQHPKISAEDPLQIQHEVTEENGIVVLGINLMDRTGESSRCGITAFVDVTPGKPGGELYLSPAGMPRLSWFPRYPGDEPRFQHGPFRF
ncbi:MAG: hypothetical protein HY319_19045 [Armatimonadetes bacterium]|nr:hypothetical protein [Armatimonadota bacterium]